MHVTVIRDSHHRRHSRLLDLDARRDWLPARHEGGEQLRTRSAVRGLKEFRFEPNRRPNDPIKATDKTPPSEDAMKLQKIVFSFDGRIGRRTYWLATLAVIVAVLVLTFAPFLLNSEAAAVLMLVVSQFVWLLSLWPILAVGAKRLHDRNKNGWWLLVFWLLPFALFCGGFSIVFFDDPRTGRSGDFSTGLIVVLASLPPALWGIVELGILPGTKGPNLYGADPAQQPA
jgi:uncharacterized membrane protein YhaH (DUF805 family)